MIKRISGRTWLSIATALILGVVLFTSRHEIARAWELLHQVDLGIIALLIPLQFISYYATGETMFSYLRAQGRVKHLSVPSLARLSLEMNFVNHVLPSAGVSGVSYMGWRLRHYGVTAGKSTAAQLVRIAATFGAYAILLLIAALFMLFDGSLNRLIAIATIVMVCLIFGLIVAMVVVLQKARHLDVLAQKLQRIANRAVRVLTFGKKPAAIASAEPLEHFLREVRKDYKEVRAHKRRLIVPLLWGFVFNIADIALFCVAFWALGHPVNPAPVVVAYGMAGAAGIFMVTPGGAGAYELIMVTILSASGINPQVAIAATVLARVLLLAGTVVAGYAFYQQAIIKHGKHGKRRSADSDL